MEELVLIFSHFPLIQENGIPRSQFQADRFILQRIVFPVENIFHGGNTVPRHGNGQFFFRIRIVQYDQHFIAVPGIDASENAVRSRYQVFQSPESAFRPQRFKIPVPNVHVAFAFRRKLFTGGP